MSRASVAVLVALLGALLATSGHAAPSALPAVARSAALFVSAPDDGVAALPAPDGAKVPALPEAYGAGWPPGPIVWKERRSFSGCPSPGAERGYALTATRRLADPKTVRGPPTVL
jgi:hypothetical protein